jgi:hypothetical protein
LLVSYGYFFPRWADWNQNSRLDLTMAIVESGSLAIDAYHMNTGDKLYVEGHYYSDKAPGLSFAAVPVYAALRPILTNPLITPLLERMGRGSALADTLNPEGSGVNLEKVRFAIAQYVLTLALVSLPSALLGVLLYRFLAQLTLQPLPRLVLVLAYGLGTVAFPYSTGFYSHQPGAVLTFSAFWLIFTGEGESLKDWRLWLAGALLGYAMLTEYQTGLIAVVLGVYAVVRRRDWKAGLLLALAALPSILVLMLYNQARFGAPLELGYKYHATFTQHAQAGFAGLAGFSWSALGDVTVSPRKGLFFRAPFLLFAPLALVGLWRSRRFRLEALCSLLIAAGYFGYAASFYDWGGGHTAGPRYLVAMLPFVVFPLISLFEAPRWRWLTLLLSAVSIVITGAETVAGQHFPYQQVTDPWGQYIWPSWQAGDIARNLGTILGLHAWYSLMPLLAVVGGLLWMLIRRREAQSLAPLP